MAILVVLTVAAAPLLAGSSAYKQGLVAHYFKDITDWNGAWHGDGSDISDAKPYTFTDYAYSRKEPLVNHQFINSGWFSIRWKGYIQVDPGHNAPNGPVDVTFELWMDDGAKLYIDGEEIISDWRPRWEQARASHRFAATSLTPGYHRIIIEYCQGQSLKKDDKDPAKLYWSSSALGIARQIVPSSHLFHTQEDTEDYVPD